MAEPEQAFIVGAQRCGTTSVASTLDRHPQVALAVPLRPEPKFFLDPGVAGDIATYLDRHFPDVGPEVTLRCEKSTSYIESDVACAQIAQTFPDARIVIVLRDPVARATSHYSFSRHHGVEDLAPDAALALSAEARPWDTEAVSVSPFIYLSRGRYVDHIARWDEAFGPDAVHLVILEELTAEPERFADLEHFLGVEPHVAFDPTVRHNAGDLRDVTLSADTRSRLEEYFVAPNADLARRLGRPIERWSHA